MNDDLYEELKKRYTSAKTIIAAKWLADEMEDKEEDTYDVPLVTIYYKDLAEEQPFEAPLMQVRVRDDNDGRGEEIVLVFTQEGCFKSVEDIDEELHFAAEVMENYTEGFLNKFPDAVLRYVWFGDDGGEEGPNE